jgi:hypothetical protein
MADDRTVEEEVVEVYEQPDEWASLCLGSETAVAQYPTDSYLRLNRLDLVTKTSRRQGQRNRRD